MDSERHEEICRAYRKKLIAEKYDELLRDRGLMTEDSGDVKMEERVCNVESSKQPTMFVDRRVVFAMDDCRRVEACRMVEKTINGEAFMYVVEYASDDAMGERGWFPACSADKCGHEDLMLTIHLLQEMLTCAVDRGVNGARLNS